MDTYQLRYWLIKLVKRIKIGVCASDQLNSVKEKEFAVISNIQDSSKEGLHWVCFFKTKKMKFVDFFDSIGNDVKSYGENFKEFVKKFKGVRQCTTQFQSDSSDICGKYCLWFLTMRSKGVTYENIVKQLSTFDKQQNDLFIRNSIKQIEFPNFSICENCEGCNPDDINAYCIQRNEICYNVKQSKFLE